MENEEGAGLEQHSLGMTQLPAPPPQKTGEMKL